MSVIIVLQARLSSTRLPGKVLQPICGFPMLGLQLERIKRAKHFERLVVATSTDQHDNPIAKLCEDLQVDCYRGSLEDVLDRFYKAAKQYEPIHVVRLTGDCPLTDPELIDAVIQHHIVSGADYTSNTMDPTFPDGLDVEVVRFSALEQAHAAAKLNSEREHVTPYFYNHPELFRLASFKSKIDRSPMRWVVDEPADFNFVTRVYEYLYSAKPNFNTNDVLALLEDNPDLALINASYRRNEGYEKSLAKDSELIANHKGATRNAL